MGSIWIILVPSTIWAISLTFRPTFFLAKRNSAFETRHHALQHLKDVLAITFNPDRFIVSKYLLREIGMVGSAIGESLYRYLHILLPTPSTNIPVRMTRPANTHRRFDIMNYSHFLSSVKVPSPWNIRGHRFPEFRSKFRSRWLS